MSTVTFDYNLDNMVSNQSMDARFRESELYLNNRLLELENRLVKWGIGLALGQFAMIAALVKLL